MGNNIYSPSSSHAAGSSPLKAVAYITRHLVAKSTNLPSISFTAAASQLSGLESGGRTRGAWAFYPFPPFLLAWANVGFQPIQLGAGSSLTPCPMGPVSDLKGPGSSPSRLGRGGWGAESTLLQVIRPIHPLPAPGRLHSSMAPNNYIGKL